MMRALSTSHLLLYVVLISSTVKSATAEITLSQLCNEILAGHFSKARLHAYDLLVKNSSNANRKEIAQTFVDCFDRTVADHSQEDFVDFVRYRLQNNSISKLPVKNDTVACNKFLFPFEASQWDSCCSILPSHSSNQNEAFNFLAEDSERGCQIEFPCCEFSVGSPSHLRLPVLQEPAIEVKIDKFLQQNSELVHMYLEQDGYLRPFDVSGILWPSGYLLTNCLFNIQRCQIDDLLQNLFTFHGEYGSYPRAIELGTGIGAPSIALSKLLESQYQEAGGNPLVLATDVSYQSLALTMANAKHNNALLDIAFLDYTNASSVTHVKMSSLFQEEVPITQPTNGFEIVIGSSLQKLFSIESSDNLWKTLDILLDKKNPHALAILVHVQFSPLEPPSDGSFDLVRRISGNAFEMQTSTGGPSDFEIYVFRRSQTCSKAIA